MGLKPAIARFSAAMAESNGRNAQTNTIKILYLDPMLPYPPDEGLKIRSFNILKEMVNRGYEVTLLCFSNNESTKVEDLRKCLDINVITVFSERPAHSHPLTRIILSIFSRKPFYVRYYWHPRFKRVVKQLTEKVNFDLLFVFTSWLVLYGLDINLPRIHDTVDSLVQSYLVGFRNSKSLVHRLYYYLEYKKWAKVYREIYPLYDYLLVTARRDADVISSYPNTNVITIPNGVDTSYFKPLHLEAIPLSMLFVGNMQVLTNSGAALYFIKEIYPRIKQEIPMARVYIVGKNPPMSLARMHDGQNIFVTGYVEDVRPYLDRCQVVVCPLRMASGIQNKILEAMAMNKPIVTTKIGVGGIEGYAEQDIIVADDVEDFAQRVIELFTNRELLQKTGKGGREFVEKNYTWAAAGNKIDCLIKELVESRAY